MQGDLAFDLYHFRGTRFGKAYSILRTALQKHLRAIYLQYLSYLGCLGLFRYTTTGTRVRLGTAFDGIISGGCRNVPSLTLYHHDGVIWRDC